MQSWRNFDAPVLKGRCQSACQGALGRGALGSAQIQALN